MGINFNNVRNLDAYGKESYLRASYPIYNNEFVCKTYFVDEWPIFYIACMPAFINSVNALPPADKDGNEDVLGMAFWSIKDGEISLSEAFVFGEHHSYISSVIEHSGMKLVDGKIIEELGSKNIVDADQLKHYA